MPDNPVGVLLADRGFKRVASDVAVTAAVEVDNEGQDLEVLVEPRGGSTGTYAKFYRCRRKRAEAYLDGVTIKPTATSGLARVSNVVTVNTATAHGLKKGDRVVIEGSTPDGATTFDGTFTVATAADSDTFTYAQTAADDTGGGGTAYRVTEVSYGTTDAVGASTSNATTPYRARLKGARGVTRIEFNTAGGADGTVDVWALALPGAG